MNQTTPHFAAHHADLERLRVIDRRRMLVPQRGLDFASNDYLGLASSPILAAAAADALARGIPIGSGGSRLLRGNHPEHETLEAEAAALFGCEAALFFSTGYAANSALFSTLPQRGDVIIYDELIHASVHEGLRLSRADSRAAAHNDVPAFAEAIADWRTGGGTGRVWIAVESLYSMDGDLAPIDALMNLADANDAVLIVDEAHATGLFGADGKGLTAHLGGQSNCITLRTLGKAVGVEGALLCGPMVMRDFLINRGRGFIFSTAPSPLMAAVARAALTVATQDASHRQALMHRIALAGELLAPLGAPATGTPIMPLIVGEDGRAVAMAQALQAKGFDIRAIRPPTVPAGTARLRISITNNVDDDDIRALADALCTLQRG